MNFDLTRSIIAFNSDDFDDFLLLFVIFIDEYLLEFIVFKRYQKKMKEDEEILHQTLMMTTTKTTP